MKLRDDLPPLPRRFAGLPIDERGFPVPWFVAWVNGKPVFQVADGQKFAFAMKHRRCWLCGQPLGRYVAFVVGPMCGINRISADPPSHQDCAEFAVQGCPFLARPLAIRSRRGIEDLETSNPGGIMIERNPGVCLMWITKTYQLIRAPGGNRGVLISMGEPEELYFYREGRHATRAEIDHSVTTGLPNLEGMAQEDGEEAIAELDRHKSRFGQLLDVWARA